MAVAAGGAAPGARQLRRHLRKAEKAGVTVQEAGPRPPFEAMRAVARDWAAGRKQAAAHYANSLDVQLVDAYGRVEVRLAGSGKPLPKTYVKVYARYLEAQYAGNAALDASKVVLACGEARFSIGDAIRLRVSDYDKSASRWVFDVERVERGS